MKQTNISLFIFKLFIEFIFNIYMYILNFTPIFASNYKLNVMLRVQEICKQQGLTMQELAKRMGVTYQALYASVSGNPTIGKLGEMADALNVGVSDLLNEDKGNKNQACCPHCGKEIKLEK